MDVLRGKRILVTGVRNTHSVSYGIARSLRREGAELLLSCRDTRTASKIQRIAGTLGGDIRVVPCDMASSSEIARLVRTLSRVWGGFDGFVHSIACAAVGQMRGDYLDAVTAESFLDAQRIGSYSFVELAQASRRLLRKNSSLVALTFLGSRRVVEHYNVMGAVKSSLECNVRYIAHCLGADGVRVNAISPGPIRTASASSIQSFDKIRASYRKHAPLVGTTTIRHVGNVSVFLHSDWSSGVTGQVIHVDHGAHAMAFVS